MRVSVIITCHNEERTIERAVLSVVEQSRFDQVEEIVVVNDGSTDGSALVLQRLLESIPALRVFQTPGLRAAAARNVGLREASGDVVAFLDGDDYWTPDKLEHQLPALARDERVGLVYGDYVDFSQDDASDARLVTVRRFDPDSPHHLRDYFVHDGPIIPSTAIVTRRALTDIGLFDEKIGIAEDTEFCLRLAETWRFCHVPEGLTYKRRHPAQASHRLDAFLPNFELLTRRYSDRFPELRPLARRRMARCHAKVSADCALKGEAASALRHAARAVALGPLYPRAWASMVMVLAPRALAEPLYRALKRLWHILRRALRRG